MDEWGITDVMEPAGSAAPDTDRGESVSSDSSPFASKGGDPMVIYIWKRNGWRKYKVRDGGVTGTG